MQDYKHIRYNLEKPKRAWGRKLLASLILGLIAATPLVYSYYKNGTLLLKEDVVKTQAKIEPIAEDVAEPLI